jgi:hypothetical protein
MAADMEVGTQAGTSLTPLTTEAIMKIMSATNLVGLQRAQSDSVTLRIRIPVFLQKKFGWICLQPGENQRQFMPAEKAQDRFESRFD